MWISAAAGGLRSGWDDSHSSGSVGADDSGRAARSGLGRPPSSFYLPCYQSERTSLN